jgi:hypothetical protein
MAGCTSLDPHRVDLAECEVQDLRRIYENPTQFDGQIFCGDVIFARPGNRLLIEYDGLKRSDGTLNLVPHVAEELWWIYDMPETYSRWRIVGTLHLMSECFEVSLPDHRNGRGCVPDFYPAEMEIHELEERPAAMPQTP